MTVLTYFENEAKIYFPSLNLRELKDLMSKLYSKLSSDELNNFENIYISSIFVAGGSTLRALSGESIAHSSSDIDIFTFNDLDKKELEYRLEKFLTKDDNTNNYNSEMGVSSYSGVIDNTYMKIQVIYLQDSIISCFEHFDFTICQNGILFEFNPLSKELELITIHVTPEFQKAIDYRKLNLTKFESDQTDQKTDKQIVKKIRRVMKYIDRGYDISDETLMQIIQR